MTPVSGEGYGDPCPLCLGSPGLEERGLDTYWYYLLDVPGIHILEDTPTTPIQTVIRIQYSIGVCYVYRRLIRNYRRLGSNEKDIIRAALPSVSDTVFLCLKHLRHGNASVPASAVLAAFGLL